jgi:hypothetical protein
MKITLTAGEYGAAIRAASARQWDAVRAGYDHTKNLNNSLDSTWGWHIVGALGEVAVAKALGIYWGGESRTLKDADLAVGDTPVQVRASTKYRGLRIRRNDRDDHLYIACTMLKPWTDWELLGWMRGGDAKRPEWNRPADNLGGESWFVPADDLRCMEDLTVLMEVLV